MKAFYATAKILYYYDSTAQEENIVITEVENFTDAMARIEAYYGDDLETVIELNLFDGPFVILNDNVLEQLACGKLTD